jgi:hypothetical protein
MKPLATILFTIILFSCKKNNNTPQQQEDPPIPHGYYIIRTKYMCADGRAFVLGSFSNHETMGWSRATPEEVKAIKEDGPPDSNSSIWKVGKSVITGPGIVEMPGPSVGNVRPSFSIYQEDLSDPDQPKRWYITTPGDSPNPDDETGFGIGPSIGISQATYSEEDLQNIIISMTYSSITDSTGRLAAWGRPYWWYISLPTDPDDICDDYNNAVIWRNSWLCPNSTTMGDAWKYETCAVNQLVLEKVE